MKILKNSFFLLFLFIVGCSHALIKTGFPIEGTWLNESYIRALQNSNSPKAASVVAEISIIEIDKNIKTIIIGYNFHEAISYTIENIDRLSGNFKLAEETYSIKSITYADNRIRVCYETYDNRVVSAEFSQISPFRNQDMEVVYPYVAQIVLSGEYSDAKDRVYTFGPRIMNWDGQSYEYVIQLDYIEFTPIDVICAKKEGSDEPCKEYGFVTNGALLDIYEYDYDNKTIGKLVLALVKK